MATIIDLDSFAAKGITINLLNLREAFKELIISQMWLSAVIYLINQSIELNSFGFAIVEAAGKVTVLNNSTEWGFAYYSSTRLKKGRLG